MMLVILRSRRCLYNLPNFLTWDYIVKKASHSIDMVCWRFLIAFIER